MSLNGLGEDLFMVGTLFVELSFEERLLLNVVLHSLLQSCEQGGTFRMWFIFTVTCMFPITIFFM
jgi:hypothetical protein